MTEFIGHRPALIERSRWPLATQRQWA